MKRLNTLNGTGLITKLFPLKEGEEVVTGAIYQLTVDGMEKVTASATSKVVGYCHGGDVIEKNSILVELNGATVYETEYTDAPAVGELLNNYQRVLTVNEEKKTYEFIIETNA